MTRLDPFHWLLIGVIACSVGLNAYLALSPYRYFHMEAPYGLIRVNRFTGEAEKLFSNGWRPMRKAAAW